MKCQVECENCQGEVETVTVYGEIISGKGMVDPNYSHGSFNYCQQAIEDDEKRGFIVKREGNE